MRMSLELIVIVIVILVVAAVVLAIFGNQLSNIVPMTDNKANCINMATASCRSLNAMPPTWNTVQLDHYGQMKTCQGITGKSECSQIISSSDTGGGSGSPAATSHTCEETTGQICVLESTGCLGPMQAPGGIGTCPDKQVCCKKT